MNNYYNTLIELSQRFLNYESQRDFTKVFRIDSHNDVAVVVACDNSRLAIIQLPLPPPQEPFCVDPRVLGSRNRLQTSKVIIDITNGFSIHFCGGTINAPRVNCHYPDWRRVIPEQCNRDPFIINGKFFADCQIIVDTLSGVHKTIGCAGQR